MFGRIVVTCVSAGLSLRTLTPGKIKGPTADEKKTPSTKKPNLKLFNDPIHGSMEFHPAIVAIIDTPEFQRLRDIRQLGAVYYVYPGASHNRYEHSLGVCHVAGQLMEHLKKNQPELNIQAEDVLTEQIAGLCHDLGHGPFSHTFDQKFIPAATGDTKFEHEELSLAMLDHMLENNKGVKKILKHYNIDDNKIAVIKALIHRKKGKGQSVKEILKTAEMTEDKQFLFEVVSNKRNGVDVDKWDYFKRDMYHLGMQAPFDHTRMMKFYRVTNDSGKTQLCSRDKEAINVYEMFTTRQIIHRRACQHKAVMAVEAMIVNGFLAADKFITFPGKGGKMLTMSECVKEKDMVAFMKLTDSVFYQILASNDERLKPAQAWLRAVQNRKMYRMVAETGPMTDPKLLKLDTLEINQKIQQEIMQYIPIDDHKDFEETSPFKFEHDMCPKYRFIIQTMRLDFGKKGKNPVDRFRFYRKTGPETTVIVKASQISTFLPQNKSEEICVRLLLRPTDDEKKDKHCHKQLKEAYNKWFTKTFPESQPQVYDWTFTGYDS